MVSLHIEGRRWFQKSWGNTYHSVRIWLDGEQVAHLPYAYGYGEQWLQTALDWLRANGYIPARVCSHSACSSYNGPAETCPHCSRATHVMYGTLYLRETLGGTYSIIDVERKKEL